MPTVSPPFCSAPPVSVPQEEGEEEGDDWAVLLRELEVDLDAETLDGGTRKASISSSRGGDTCKPLQCYHCRGEDLAREEATLVCRNCSTVVTRFVDSTPEWRFYGAEDSRDSNPARCGPPVNDLIPTMGASLFTVHGSSKKRGVQSSRYGHGAPRFMQRCHMWNSMTHKERALYSAFNTLTIKAANNGIATCILEEAKRLYKRVFDSRFSRGENRKALVACSVYMACKRNGVPRSLREITTMFDVSPVAMTRGCKMFQEELEGDVVVAKSACPNDFVSRFCSRLNIDREAADACKMVVELIQEHDLVTHCTPPAIVAGVIFMCCAVRGISVTVHDIASAAQISATTIAKSHKQLVAQADLLIPLLKGEDDEDPEEEDGGRDHGDSTEDQDQEQE